MYARIRERSVPPSPTFASTDAGQDFGLMQWRVTVTDNHGEDWLFVVSADGEREALDLGRTYFRRQAARGTYATAASARRDSSESICGR